jgi:hypothetical protein
MLGTARSAAEQHRESVAQTQIGMSARPSRCLVGRRGQRTAHPATPAPGVGPGHGPRRTAAAARRRVRAGSGPDISRLSETRSSTSAIRTRSPRWRLSSLAFRLNRLELPRHLVVAGCLLAGTIMAARVDRRLQANASWAARTPLFRLTSLSSPGAATRSPTR